MTGLAVGIVIGGLFLWVPYLLLKRSPRRWWLYTGLLMIPFLVLMILVQPVWIDPLFNDFGPMKNKALEANILALAERSGIEGGRVYEVAKSEDTKVLNVYVTGFGNTKRIVLWDTTIAKLDEQELLFVMGHEMGHYVLGHVWKSILFFSAVIMATLLAIHKTAGWLIARYQGRFGFSELSDVASLPLILLLFSAYLFVVTPGVLAFTRSQEHESDRFGLEILQNNRAAATAFVKLQTENLGIPRPHWLVRLWQASHPTLGERIDFCNAYRPWTKARLCATGTSSRTGSRPRPPRRTRSSCRHSHRIGSDIRDTLVRLNQAMSGSTPAPARAGRARTQEPCTPSTRHSTSRHRVAPVRSMK